MSILLSLVAVVVAPISTPTVVAGAVLGECCLARPRCLQRHTPLRLALAVRGRQQVGRQVPHLVLTVLAVRSVQYLLPTVVVAAEGRPVAVTRGAQAVAQVVARVLIGLAAQPHRGKETTVVLQLGRPILEAQAVVARAQPELERHPLTAGQAALVLIGMERPMRAAAVVVREPLRQTDHLAAVGLVAVEQAGPA